MRISANRRAALLATLAALAATTSPAAPAPQDAAAVAREIKSDVAKIVAGINAHDPDKATAFDAQNVVSIECGSAPAVGIDVDREGFRAGFAHDPDWKVSLIDETVDVAAGADMAIYRGTYHEDHGGGDVLMTHKTNFLAEFKRQGDGSWKMVWYSVSYMERAHPKPRPAAIPVMPRRSTY